MSTAYTGTIYGGRSKVSRLPRSTRVMLAVVLAVFVLMFTVLFVRAVWLNAEPPAYVPQPTPTTSPASGVGHGPWFG